MRLGPAGHAGEGNTAADDEAELAVGKILRLGCAEVGDSGVKIAADAGLAGAVGSMANGAASDVTFAGFLQDIRSGRPRVGFETGLARDSKIARGAGEDGFKAGRGAGGGETVAEQIYAVEDQGEKNRGGEEKERFRGVSCRPPLAFAMQAAICLDQVKRRIISARPHRRVSRPQSQNNFRNFTHGLL